jgi:uncharacterized membrane protein YfcA
MVSLLASVHLHYLWLTVVAFLAGMLNAVAGGGSFLLFPMILSLPILPIQANATNTVALWPGQFTSILGYRKDIRKNLRQVIPILIVSFVGGTAGAVVLLNTPQMTFLHLVPWLLLIAALIFAVSGPLSRWISRRKQATVGATHAPRLAPLLMTLLIVTFYIGYFGAGAGFLIITTLSLFGYPDLHEINAIKVAATTVANGVAFLIFVFDGQVIWHYCLTAMVACAIGGYCSASLAKRVPQALLRALVVLIGLGMATFFFWKNG